MIRQFLLLALICAGMAGVASAQMSGTYTVNNAGGANFTSLGAAFTALETQGVNGAVVIEIYDDGGTYTTTNEYALGTGNGTTTAAAVSGLSATNTLTIRAASGENPVFSGSSAISKFGTSYTGTIAFANTSYTTVEGLTVLGGTSFGIHLYSDTTTTNFTVRRCTVYNCGVGIYLYGNGGTVNNSFVENNFVYNCPVTGSFASFSQGAIGFRRPSSVTLQHNTVVRNSGTTYGAYGWSGGTSYKPTFRYNIGIAQVSGSKCISNDTTGMLPTVCDYNCWYFTGGATFHSNTAYSTFSAWQTAGFDANGMNTNPLLTSTSTSGTDLHLQSSSPCIDAATTSSFNIDIDGDSRPNGSARDIGGDEFVPAGPTITLNTNTLALGTTTQGTAGSAASYKVTGSLLTGNTTITAPTDVQIKLSTDTTWGTTIVVPVGSGNWGPLTVD
ncbi:MAG: hypothetical protein KDB32_05970, partial [Planctomycetes bacterium]|nr:hypothetical protein [Planctomycetota bacterium]